MKQQFLTILIILSLAGCTTTSQQIWEVDISHVQVGEKIRVNNPEGQETILDVKEITESEIVGDVESVRIDKISKVEKIREYRHCK